MLYLVKDKCLKQGVLFWTDFIHTKTSGVDRQQENCRTYLQVCYLQKNLKIGFPIQHKRETRTDEQVLEFKRWGTSGQKPAAVMITSHGC